MEQNFKPIKYNVYTDYNGSGKDKDYLEKLLNLSDTIRKIQNEKKKLDWQIQWEIIRI